MGADRCLCARGRRTGSSLSPGEAAGSPSRPTWDRTKPRLQSTKGWKGGAGAEDVCRPAGAWCAGRPLNPRPCRGLHSAAPPRLLGQSLTVGYCNSTDRLWKAVLQNRSCEDVSTYISCAPMGFCDIENKYFPKKVAAHQSVPKCVDSCCSGQFIDRRPLAWVSAATCLHLWRAPPTDRDQRGA